MDLKTSGCVNGETEELQKEKYSGPHCFCLPLLDEIKTSKKELTCKCGCSPSFYKKRYLPPLLPELNFKICIMLVSLKENENNPKKKIGK